MSDTAIQEKLTEISEGVKAAQDRMKNIESKYDGLDVEVLNKAADDAAKGLEALQALEQKIKADELMDRLFAIEKAVAEDSKKDDTELNSQHKKDFFTYLRKGTPVPIETVEAYCQDVAAKTLLHADETKVAAYVKDLVEGSNPDGGYFITPERSAMIMRRVFETSPMRSICNVVTTSSNAMEFVIDDDEPNAGWVGEVETRAATTTPQVGVKTIPVHELYAMPQATQRMLDDAGFDIEGWLQGKVSARFSRLENTAFVVGNGSKKPKGFLTYPDWAAAGTYERDALEYIDSTGTAATLDEADDLISLQCALIEDYQPGAVFLMSRDTFCTVIKLKDTDGQYLINPMLIREGADKMLLGKPVVIASDMPAVASASLSVAYGNFQEGYTIVDRFGVRVLRDPYTNKPFIRFYSTKRVGGDVTNYEAIKILKIKAS